MTAAILNGIVAGKGEDGVARITVWTKQHQSVWDTLEREGRYIARREFIEKDLQEHAELVLQVYDWLVAHGPDRANRPPDVEYPVWVSYARETTMLPSPGTVILELELEERLITPVHIGKWGSILNYSYIPADAADAKRHERLLADYGVSDAKAFMSQFYPAIKREIVASWDRLFDDAVTLGNGSKYGNIWEVRREWVKQVIR